MCGLFVCGHCYRDGSQLNSYTCHSLPPVTFQVLKSHAAHQPPKWDWERRTCVLTVVSAGQMQAKQPFTASMRYQEGGDGFFVAKTTNALLSVALRVRRTPLTLSPLVSISGVLLDHHAKFSLLWCLETTLSFTGHRAHFILPLPFNTHEGEGTGEGCRRKRWGPDSHLALCLPPPAQAGLAAPSAAPGPQSSLPRWLLHPPTGRRLMGFSARRHHWSSEHQPWASPGGRWGTQHSVRSEEMQPSPS